MSTTDTIRLHYPLPLAKLYEAMRLETEPRQRVRKLVDLFERTTQYLVLVGLAWLGQELSLGVLAGLLAVIGYSVNDSVVLWTHVQRRRAEIGRKGDHHVGSEAR